MRILTGSRSSNFSASNKPLSSKINAQRQTREDITDLQSEISEIKELLITRNSPTDFKILWKDFLVDISKNRITDKTLNLLFELAKECGVKEAISKQFNGEIINETENRAVLHTAIRSDGREKILLNKQDVVPSIIKNREKIKEFTDSVISGKLKGSTNKPFTAMTKGLFICPFPNE